jgi:predicted TIM-barrel fold metal-dependent hydrolase
MFPTTDADVWEQELSSFVPEHVFDAHVHMWRPEDVPADIEIGPSDVGMETFRGYTMDDFKASSERLLPGRSVSALVFGMVHKDLPRENLNKYVAEVQRSEPAISALAVVSPSDPMEDVERWIGAYGLLGYKPYWNLVERKKQIDVTIRDMLSPDQLNYANQRGLSVLLHVPRPMRLADPLNKAQIRELAGEYPNVTWILAHIGRAYFMAALEGHIEEVCDLDNVYFDLAFVGSAPVIAYAIRAAGVRKIVFGTDLPVADVKGKNVDFNNQRLYVTEEPRAWSMSSPELGLEFTRFYYEELRAIKGAARQLRLSDAQIEDIFFRNAERLIRPGRPEGT